MAEPLPKGFDTLLKSAFEAGWATREASLSRYGRHKAYQEWRQRWAGQPHEDQEQAPREAPHVCGPACAEEWGHLVADPRP